MTTTYQLMGLTIRDLGNAWGVMNGGSDKAFAKLGTEAEAVEWRKRFADAAPAKFGTEAVALQAGFDAKANRRHALRNEVETICGMYPQRADNRPGHINVFVYFGKELVLGDAYTDEPDFENAAVERLLTVLTALSSNRPVVREDVHPVAAE